MSNFREFLQEATNSDFYSLKDWKARAKREKYQVKEESNIFVAYEDGKKVGQFKLDKGSNNQGAGTFNYLSEGKEESMEYKEFFKKALKKFGVTEPDQLEGTKKKEFFDYVDANWDAEEETDMDESYTFDRITPLDNKNYVHVAMKDKDGKEFYPVAISGKVDKKTRDAIVALVKKAYN